MTTVVDVFNIAYATSKLQGLELFDVYHQVAIVLSFSFVIFLLLLSNQIKTDKRAIVIKYLIFFTFIQEIIDYLDAFNLMA